MQEFALQETMIYSVKTAVMGMLIVFSFLALLSLLMWAIKAFFGRVMQVPAAGKPAGRRARWPEGKRRRRGSADAVTHESAENEQAEGHGAAAGAGQGTRVPDWLSAAVAVYLLLEDEEAESSAEPWRPTAAGDPRGGSAQLWILSGEQKI